jgi:hypothetical protein
MCVRHARPLPLTALSASRARARPSPACFAVLALPQYMSNSPRIPWGLHELSVMNTVIALPAMFVFYDFFYCLWHRLLHVRGIYGWIHKHHHRQVSTSRRHGNTADRPSGRRGEEGLRFARQNETWRIGSRLATMRKLDCLLLVRWPACLSTEFSRRTLFLPSAHTHAREARPPSLTLAAAARTHIPNVTHAHTPTPARLPCRSLR